MTTKNDSLPPIVRLAAALIIFVIVVGILKEMAMILQPLFIAIFFFYIGSPIKKALIRLKVPSFIANLAIIVITVGIMTLFGWIISAYMDDIRAQIPAFKDKWQTLSGNLSTWASHYVPFAGDRLRRALSMRDLPIASVGQAASSLFGGIFESLSATVLVLFYLIFINYEAYTLPRRLEAAYGKERSGEILKIGQRINSGIISYIYVKTIVSLVAGAVSTIIFFAFGVELAILWGTLTFFANFIPYVGPIIAYAFPVLYALLQFDHPMTVLWLAIVLVVAQMLVDNYLQPKLAEEKLSLSPLITMLSIPFWGWLWGPLGIILSIPIMVSLKFVLENLPSTSAFASLMGESKK